MPTVAAAAPTAKAYLAPVSKASISTPGAMRPRTPPHPIATAALRGLTEDEMPKLGQSLKARWPTLIPLALLIAALVAGRTPYLAAFLGISSCAIVGLSTRVAGNTAKHWALLVALHLALCVIGFGGLEEGPRLAVFALA
ncbi:MAG: TRAP transporter large permease subunit, partial [Betaproteobacteria bacterium]|nr:TRAP transporter large permease subunit [Betaproteobacteria bacterium]